MCNGSVVCVRVRVCTLHVSRQDRDSKDEALKAALQAEKELEQIKKLIEDSGGKLSNRDILSEVGLGHGWALA